MQDLYNSHPGSPSRVFRDQTRSKLFRSDEDDARDLDSISRQQREWLLHEPIPPFVARFEVTTDMVMNDV